MWETLSSTLVTVACTPFGVAALVFYVPYTFGSRTTCEEIGGRQGIESNRGKGNRRYRQGRLGEGSISGVQTHTHSMEKKREGEQAREGSRRPTALLPGREMDRASARRIDAKSRRTRSSPKGSLLSPPLVPAAYPLLLSLSLLPALSFTLLSPSSLSFSLSRVHCFLSCCCCCCCCLSCFYCPPSLPALLTPVTFSLGILRLTGSLEKHVIPHAYSIDRVDLRLADTWKCVPR